MVVPAMVLVAVAIAAGVSEARLGSSPTVVALSALTLLLLSNLVACWPYFIAEAPSSWLHTYSTGLLATGTLSVALHVVPFLLSWFLVRRFGGASTPAA